MDTAAYLTSQGWAGHGHALHHSGRGITKPLAVTQKNNVLGIGKKRHDAHADQWWARAFDETLKGINTTTNEGTGRIEGVVLGNGARALEMAGRGGGKWVGGKGLYGHFVRGESLSGTLTPEEGGGGGSKETSTGGGEVKIEELEDVVMETVPKEKKEKKKKSKKQSKKQKQKHREVVAGDSGAANFGDVMAGRGVGEVREEPTQAISKGSKKSKKRKHRDAEAEAQVPDLGATAERPIQIQKKWKRRNDSKERVIGKADTLRLRLLDIASQPKCPMSQQKSPKNWLDPEKTKAREEKRRKKAKVQRAIESERKAIGIQTKPVREKKYIDSELHRAMIARKNDRHKAVKTKKMIEDDRESNQKRWKGEFSRLDTGRKKNSFGFGGIIRIEGVSDEKAKQLPITG
ncbi:hypothetical protein OEA41_004889 [Lepraria neglecta]|uniref:Uncharacterized protein n=1 Tax=Lepraria neglecta TaxID=209136 RepID=A0AAD9Z011_9LECA|nr:hypothetical protein OEA41_004889 [Lepraria neglecta]